ncbi:hypothetical protein PPL_10312 [Heterostelium album PN500]|uniref:Uncharacterized protein n=1 Tax=Heterostelium pallidum (strain ATCC 26659 / Pp 5 / PN500) TaxID=670386 RepID=D3BPZ3_HETP5|nr:hypothetical protein PPL_10312 [Heterostelium album PN500]EFA76544.1 hypothetical protein PPL_10312 [Heterostelium album PN500]|eukprot:XP_020428676.1 hypothetical protein PPL_10312 [Heterostelium album PN500]
MKDNEFNGFQEEVKQLQSKAEEYFEKYLETPSTYKRDSLILKSIHNNQ